MIAAAASAVAVTPGELRTFTDWTVGCDNGRACQAVALLPEPDLEGTMLILRRDAGPAAQPTIEIITTEDGRWALQLGKARIALPVDGKVPAKDVPAVLEALRRDPKLQLVNEAGKPVTSVSLAGASAAMLYIDDKQKRIGTTSALVRKGTGVAPPAPALPVIARPIAPKLPPRTVTKAQALKPFAELECEADAEFNEPEAVRLDARHSLAIVMQPCGNGAYNYFGEALIIDEAGKIAAAQFDSSPGMGPDDGQSMVNPSWNAEKGVLETFAKGRGVGDCGVTSSFAWDGARFRLVEQAEMGECRGSTDYITTWRAELR